MFVCAFLVKTPDVRFCAKLAIIGRLRCCPFNWEPEMKENYFQLSFHYIFGTLLVFWTPEYKLKAVSHENQGKPTIQ